MPKEILSKWIKTYLKPVLLTCRLTGTGFWEIRTTIPSECFTIPDWMQHGEVEGIAGFIAVCSPVGGYHDLLPPRVHKGK